MGLVCEECGYKNCSHVDPTDTNATPRIGDVSVCLNCGFLTIFASKDEELYLRPMYESDLVLFSKETQVQIRRILNTRNRIVIKEEP